MSRMLSTDQLATLRTAAARRAFLQNSGVSLGAAALALLERGPDARAAAIDPAAGRPAAAARVHPPLPGLPHHAAKAKSVIYIHVNGGPSQIDLWDYKPKLQEFFDKDLPPTAEQSAGAKQAMVLGFVWIPLVCQVIAMVLLRWYRLRREDLADAAGAGPAPAGAPA